MTILFRLSYGPEDSSCTVSVSAGLSAGISLGKVGDMARSRRSEIPDYARFLDSLGMPDNRVFGVQQVHSKKVITVDHQSPRSLEAVEADGLVTSRRDLLLTVTVADCLPIFLVDERTGAFGLVHSGWKGTGIIVEALHVMAEAFGTVPSDVTATIGPGIGPCCYAVPRERYEHFRAEFGERAALTTDGAMAGLERGDFRLDLKAANAQLMESAGVERVFVATDCTCCSPSLGSFRRDGQGFRRMLAYIGVKPAGGA
jgi:polyphenol oxidase